MLICTPCFSNRLVNAVLVNCAPWSVLKISGCPCCNAQSNAELQKALEQKGLSFNTTDPNQFQQALAKTSCYKDAKSKFGDEAWGLLQKYAGAIG